MTIPYSEIMKDYGKNTPSIYSMPVFLHEYMEIENIVGKGYKVLDFGCGEGKVYTAFLEALPFDIEYVGIDNDPSLKADFPLYESIEAFEEAGYKARYFDGLFMLDVLEHLNPDEAYDTLTRLNRYIDGDIIIMTPNSKGVDYIHNDPQHVAIYPPHWIDGLLKHLGFTNIKIMRGKGLHRIREIEYNNNRDKNARYKAMNDSQKQICMALGLDWYGNILAIGSRE